MNGSSTWELLAVIKNLAGLARNTEWMTRNQKGEKSDQPQTCWWGQGGGLKSRREVYWSPEHQYLTKWEWDSTINYRTNLHFNIRYFKTGYFQQHIFTLQLDNILYQYDFVIAIWYDMIWYDMIWYDMIWYDDIFLDFGYVTSVVFSLPGCSTLSNTCERTTFLQQHRPNIHIKVFGQNYWDVWWCCSVLAFIKRFWGDFNISQIHIAMD